MTGRLVNTPTEYKVPWRIMALNLSMAYSITDQTIAQVLQKTGGEIFSLIGRLF